MKFSRRIMTSTLWLLCFISTAFLSQAQVNQRVVNSSIGNINFSVVLAQPAANLDQGKNEHFNTPLTPMAWVNGNLNANQSHYIEGQSVAYRLIMTDMPTNGTEVTLTMGFDLINGSKYAIDFLTGHQQLQPHNFISHTSEEDVFPAAGAFTDDMIITLPSYLGVSNNGIEGVVNARNHFNSLPAEDKNMYLWGANFNDAYGVTYVYKDGSNVINEVQVLELTRGETKVEWTIKFTPTQETVTLGWGGHIARRQDWGVSPIRSAGGISGSPYHMRTKDWSLGNLGNQDRSLQIALAGPICPADLPVVPVSLCYNPNTQTNYPVGQCPSICAGGTLSFRVPFESSDPAVSTYAWSVSPSGGVTINPAAANTQIVSMTFANSGVYTISVIVTNNSGLQVTCTQQVTVNTVTCSITGNNNVCPGSSNVYTAPLSSTYQWGISGNATISGPSNGQTVTVIAGASCGSYTLSLTVTQNGCTTTCQQTFSVTDTQPPTIQCPAGGALGCNPTSIPGPGTPVVSDNCGTPTVTSILGDPVNTGGCNWSRTRTYTATDACGNTATCTQVFTYTIATTPVLANCGQTTALGCNPTTLPSCANTATLMNLGAVTASNECGPVTVNCSAGTVQVSGCNRSQVFTFTATACGLTSTCTRTYTWTAVTAPVFANCGQTTALGCNPTTLPSCANTATLMNLGAVTASNECGPVTVDCTAGTVQTSGCNRTQVLTFTATSCGLTSTCTRTYTWTVVTAPVFANCGQTTALGCNPTTLPSCANTATLMNLGAVTASNECGPVTVNCSAGTVQTSGCNRTQVLTFTATSCGLTSTCTRTYTWTVVTAPVFANCGQTTALGCNPTTLPSCANTATLMNLGAVTASNECGPVTVDCTAGTVQTSGCNRTQVLTFTATSCGLTSTCTRTYTWTVVTAPVFANCGQTTALGCNPTTLPSCANTATLMNLGAVTASNECGPVTVNCSAGTVQTSGCNRTQVLTFTATSCGLTSTCTRTYTWTVVTAPVFANCGQTTALGCNPTTLPSCANTATLMNLGAVTASNECGPVTVDCTAGTVQTSGCNRTQVLTFTATSCGLTSTCTRTYTWTVVTAPVFANCGQTTALGCNPTTLPSCANTATLMNLGAVTASNECGPVTVNCSAGTVQTSGCNRTQVLTFTATSCGLTSTCTRTYTWTVVTAPVFANCGQTTALGCNPTTLPSCANTATLMNLGAVTASNECGPVTVDCTAGTVQTSGCNRTQVLTFTATSCGLTSTCTRTYTWTVVTAPVFANCGQTTALGCNPTTLPSCANTATLMNLGAVTASNECGPVTVNCSAGTVQTSGCNRTQVLTFTATSCGLTSTCTRTYTWTVVTAPVFANCGQTTALGCNPTTLPSCANTATLMNLGAVTASNECGPVTVDCTAGTVQTSGCNRTQVLTFTATSCGLTSTCTRTYTWTVVTAPVFANCGQTTALGCNPTTLPSCANTATLMNLGAVTASNECGPVTVDCTAGTVQTSGCNRTQVLTFTATSCGLTSTCTRTYTWTVVTAPVFANCGQTTALGCNPTTLPSCANTATLMNLGAVTASNECGPVTVDCTAGTVQTSGCNRTQVLTFTATSCGLTSTCTRTYTWTVVTAPVFANCGQTTALGCNPTTLPSCANTATLMNLGAVTASNECGPVTVNCSAGTVQTSGCNRTQVLTFTATSCGLTSTCTRTYTWTVVTAPVFANCGQTTALGCNPTTLPSCANTATLMNLGAVTASNECGPVTVNCSAGTVQTSGCNRTQVLTFTATSCGLTSTCTRTYTWTVVTAPVFANCGQTRDLGCNPTTLPSCANTATLMNLGAVTASNECGPVTVTCEAGTVQTSGCNRTQVLTFTATSCGLTSTCSRTYTWKVDTNAPTVSNNPPTEITAACGTTFPNLPWEPPTWVDNCTGAITVTIVTTPNEQQPSCPAVYTRTWTATDGCLNSATFTQTITVPCCTVCTYTQGAYGNPGGNGCVFPGPITTSQNQIMINALTSEPGQFKVFGRLDLNRYWYIRLSDVNTGGANAPIFKMLPGGGSSKVFLADTYSGVPEYSNEPSWPVAPLKPSGSKKGKIENQLFSQTLTLYFNLKNNVNLGGMGLADSIITADALCGSNVPIPNTEDTFGIPHDVAVYLAGGNGYANTVQGLFLLANDMLGGVNTGLDLDEVQEAVEAINSGFDECRIFIGYAPYVPPTGRMIVHGDNLKTEQFKGSGTSRIDKSPNVTVTSFPNPYNDRISFVVSSSVSGNAVLDVFTLDGAKIKTVYTGYIHAGKGETIQYSVPNPNRVSMFYVLRLGDQTVTGKLVNVK